MYDNEKKSIGYNIANLRYVLAQKNIYLLVFVRRIGGSCLTTRDGFPFVAEASVRDFFSYWVYRRRDERDEWGSRMRSQRNLIHESLKGTSTDPHFSVAAHRERSDVWIRDERGRDGTSRFSSQKVDVTKDEREDIRTSSYCKKS